MTILSFLLFFLFIAQSVALEPTERKIMTIRSFLLLFPVLVYSMDLQASDGDVVRCMDKYKQPAFSHPFLKNHKIQEIPSEIPVVAKIQKKNKWHTSEAYVSTAKCPPGTVPKRWDGVNSDTGPKFVGNTTSTTQHEYADATMKAEKLFGAKAIINVWDPIVEDKDTEFSLSQIWINSGSYETEDLNTIEVGWQVCPTLYNDSKPRLFIFWTSDAYQTTGGYNIQSPGFIQTSNRIVLGGSISPISSFGGIQYEITILVWKDQISGNWWLSLGPNNTLVGYWPKEIFTGLADHATQLVLGGEIVDSYSFGRHTKTHMGSGHFPEEGFKKASYFRNLEIVDINNSFQKIQKIETHATNETYYNILYRDEWESYFFYGGSGFSQIHSGVGVVSLNLYWFLSCVSFSFFIIL